VNVGEKRLKLILYASIAVDLVVVAVLVVLVNPYVGLLAAAALAAGEYAFYRVLLRPAVIRQEVLSGGRPGEARVLEVDTSGLGEAGTLQRVPASLEVRPADGEPYELDTVLLVEDGQLPALTPGAVVPVMIDPGDPRNVALGGPEAGGSIEEAAEDRLREAREMVEASEEVNSVIRESGLPAGATVLKAWELGVTVNRNPAMQFLLDVQPADGQSFQAQATAVVSQASIAKFQPGEVIQVRYDPEDLTRVAVTHS